MVGLRLLLLHAALALANSVNITYDDSNLTFFHWTGGWNAITPQTPCTTCYVQPLSASTYNSTWHDGGSGNGSSVVFNGSDIYIYGIDVLNPGIAVFTLDGNTPTSHAYSGSLYVYNSLFFAAHGLSTDVQHNLSWVVEASSVGGAVCLFYYATVTTVLSTDLSSASSSNTSSPSSTAQLLPSLAAPPSSSSTTHVTARARLGVSLAAVVALLLVIGITWFMYRRMFQQRRKHDTIGNTIMPSVLETSGMQPQTSPLSNVEAGGRKGRGARQPHHLPVTNAPEIRSAGISHPPPYRTLDPS